MREAGKRALLWVALILAVAAGVNAAPGIAAIPLDELTAAGQEAELGGLTSQTALRAMLWAEPRAAAAFVPLKPAAAEEVHLAEAEARAKAILTADPARIEALVLLGRLAWIGGRANEATSYFQRALLYAADSSQALLGLADLCLDRRETERARAYLASIKSAGTELAEAVTLRLAILALWQGDAQGAVTFLSSVSPPPGDEGLPYLWAMAKGLAATGRTQAAAAILAREVPVWARGLWAEQSGLLAPAAGGEETGLAELSRAGAAAPGYPLPQWERGLLLLDKGDTNGALSAFAGDPGGFGELSGGVLFLRGTAEEEGKNPAGAARVYSELIGKRPRLGLAYYGLGRSYQQSQRLSEALRYLNLGLKVSPKLPCLYLQRAEVYERLKMRSQAKKDLETAVSIKAVGEASGWRLQVQAVSGPDKVSAALVWVTGGNGSLRGLFISRDGRRWRWHPWHLTPVVLRGLVAGQRVYVIPDCDGAEDLLLTGVTPQPLPLDQRAPAIVRPCAVVQDGNGPSAVWSTDEPAKAELTVWPYGGTEVAGLKFKEAAYTLWHRVSLGDLMPREYYLRVTMIDAAGNTTTSDPVLFRLDQPAYTLAGKVSINGGAAYVNQRKVALHCQLEGGEQGAFVRVGNDDGLFSNWMPLTPVLSWDLSPGDGLKTVAVQFRRGEALSPVYNANITLDTRPPVIYGVLVPSVSETAANLTWQTDEAAGTRLELQVGPVWSTVFVGPGFTMAHTAQVTGLSPGTRYAARIIATDQAGNAAQAAPVEFATVKAPDRTPPTGWLQINGGAPYARSIDVTLTIEASDDDSGVREMSFSNDRVLWSMREPFTRTKQWRLAPGDGPKQVYLRLTDVAGNESSVISAEITLDTKPPAVFGLSAQPQSDGRLVFSWHTDELSHGLVQIGLQPTFFPPDQSELRGMELARDHTVALFAPVGPGPFYYRIAALDQAGNLSISSVGSLTLPRPDFEGPTGGIRINEGQPHTSDPRVILTLWADDASGVAGMRLRNGDAAWGPWETFVTRRYWTLSPGSGDKEVQVVYKDGRGNESQVYRAVVKLDADASLPRDLAWTQTGPRTVSVRWRTDEPTTGTVYYRKSSGGSEFRQGESGPAYDHQVTLTNLDPGATYRARVAVIDRAGNRAESPEFIITVAGADQTRPTGTVTINGGAGFTKSNRVTLNLNAADPGGAVVSMSFSVDGRNWSQDEPYQATRAYTLPGGDGQKTVYARFRDKAGLYSEPASDSIVLDTRSPAIGNVTVDQAGSDTVEIVWRTDEPTFGIVRFGAGMRNYGESGAEDRTLLPQQDGGFGYDHRVRLSRLIAGRTYYAVVEAVDRADNRATSPEFSFTTAAADRTPPTGTIKINGGAAFTNRPQVTLNLAASDQGGAVTGMSFSTDGRSWSPDEPYQAVRNFTLPGGDGPKSVQVRFRDQAGNYSQPVAATITLDTAPPVISQISVRAAKHTAEITWRTNEPSWGEVRYGRESRNHNANAKERGSRETGAYGYEHLVVLEDLKPGWDYYFVIAAYDRAGNSGISAEGRFSPKDDGGPGPILPTPSGNGPVISTPPGAAPGTNVARTSNGGRVTATRLIRPKAGCGPEAAADGNAGTYWYFAPTIAFAQAPAQSTAVWQVEFRQEYRLARLGLTLATAGEFTVEYRRGGQWAKAYAVNRNNIASFTKGQRNGVLELVFDLGFSADAVRITWQGIQKSQEIRLFEVAALTS
ncbi:MAG: fibronectin type III domain-containing protein [Bacteroidota bacterium]